MGIIEHLESGRQFTLNARVLVGRGRGCALRLDDSRTSREHAVVWWTTDGWRLRDLGSHNGTFIDTRLIDVG